MVKHFFKNLFSKLKLNPFTKKSQVKLGLYGPPNGGKSTLAKALAKKYGWFRLDLHKHYRKISASYNSHKKCYDVDLKKLELMLRLFWKAWVSING